MQHNGSSDSKLDKVNADADPISKGSSPAEGIRISLILY